MQEICQPSNKTVVHYDLDTFFCLCRTTAKQQANWEAGDHRWNIRSWSSGKLQLRNPFVWRPFGDADEVSPETLSRVFFDPRRYGELQPLFGYCNTGHCRAGTRIRKGFDWWALPRHYRDGPFFGCMKWAQELRHTIIKESGLPISFGLSVNKTVSKIATSEAKPNGEKEVPQRAVQPFLDPLSIRKIPMVGAKTYYLLRSMGIETIHTLAGIPIEMMQQVLGENGIAMWKKAHGIDNTPVKPYSEQNRSAQNELWAGYYRCQLFGTASCRYDRKACLSTSEAAKNDFMCHG